MANLPRMNELEWLRWCFNQGISTPEAKRDLATALRDELGMLPPEEYQLDPEEVDEMPLLETEDFFEKPDICDSPQQELPLLTEPSIIKEVMSRLPNPTQELANRLGGHSQAPVRRAVEEGMDPDDIAEVLKQHGIDF